MGGSNKDTKDIKLKIKQKITTALEAEISTNVENTKKMMSEITSNIITNKENEMTQGTTVEAVASNLMEGVNIVLAGGSKGNITQDADSYAQGKLIAKIITDSKDDFDYRTLIESQTEAGNEVQSKLDAALKQAAQLEAQKSSSEGGISDMISSLTDMAEGMIGNLTGTDNETEMKSDTQIEKEIEARMRTKIENTVVNMTDVKSKFASSVETNFKTKVNTSCAAGSAARNEMKKTNFSAYDGSELVVFQKATAKAAGECIADILVQGSTIQKMQQDGVDKGLFTLKSDADSKSDSSQDAKMKDLEEKTDAMEEMIKEVSGDVAGVVNNGIDTAGGVATSGMTMLLLPMIIIGGGVALFIVFKMFSGNKNQGNNNSFDNTGDGYDYTGGAIGGMELKRAIVMIGFFVVLDQVLKRIYK